MSQTPSRVPTRAGTRFPRGPVREDALEMSARKIVGTLLYAGKVPHPTMGDQDAVHGADTHRLPPVGVVVLNYNGLEDTLECIGSLRRSQGIDVRIIVVDNGSTNGSAGAIGTGASGVTLIRNPRNLGFAAGVNVGVRRALEESLPYLFLLNNDAVVEPELLRETVAFAEAHPDMGVLGPRIVRYDAPETNQLPWQDKATHPFDTIGLSGSAVLIRASTLEKVGLFDPTYFMYWEEKDFFERCQRGGFRTVYVPTHARVLHKIGASTSRVPGLQEYYMIRNGFIFIRRYKGTASMARHLLRSLASLLKPGPSIRSTSARARGLRDGLVMLIRNPPANARTH